MTLWPFGKKRNPIRAAQEIPAEYRAAVLAPDWDAFAKHYGVPVPATLRQLYSLGERLFRTPLTVELQDGTTLEIQYFEPVTEENVKRGERYAWRYFPFARDSDSYALAMSVTEAGAPVCIDFRDADPVLEPLAVSIGRICQELESM